MIQLKKASRGQQLPSLPAVFIHDWYKSKFNVLVDLPVATQKSLLVFSIQNELKKREQFRKLSEKSYITLISIVSSSLASLDTDATKKAISKAGLDIEESVVDSIINEVKKEVTKQISGAGIASILVNDVLQSKMQNVEKINDVTFPDVVSAISRVQDLYASFANSESLAVVGEQITSMFQTEPLIKHVYDIFTTFTRHKSATVKGRLTYALDSLYEHTFGESMMDVSTHISGVHYHIDQVKIVKDLKYRQAVCMYFISLRGLMGIEATEGDQTVELSELLDHFLLNTPQNLPSLPKDLQCTAKEIKDAQKVFTRLWLMNIYEMILTNDEGQLAHQISNVMEERKYTRNESWDSMVREGIHVASLLFTAYIKTGAQFRDWARDESIYFANDPNLPHNLKLKLNKFVFEIVEGYNTLLALDHVRFLHNPAHIVNYASGTPAATDIQYYVPDDQLKFSKAQWIITPELDRTLIYKNQKLLGTDLDVELDILRPLLPMASPIKTLLGITIARPNLFGGDISAAFLGIRFIEDLIKTTPIPGEILRQSELVYIKNVFDLAEYFELPEELAESLFKAPGMYASLERQAIMFMTWDFDAAPVVEFVAADTARSYVPFVAKWPYLLTYTNKLPSIAGVPGLKLDPPKPKGPKDPKDPKDPIDPKDPKDPKDPADPKDPKDPTDPKE